MSLDGVELAESLGKRWMFFILIEDIVVDIAISYWYDVISVITTHPLWVVFSLFLFF